MNNFLHTIITEGFPYIISVMEIMGSFIIAFSGISAFIRYFQCVFARKPIDIQTAFSKSLVTGLEFLMAGEIFKTILVQSLEEIFILAGIITIRIALTILIHFEGRENHGGSAKHQDAEKSDTAQK